ncbi:MAG: DUF2029 domain-containing protein [Paludibacteraceae bacterium]|nr:DUF2029 domain-containing protein [Paludibacteraceae bacterium]
MNWSDSKLRKILTNRWTLFGIFTLIGLAAALFKLAPDRHNNYLIFCGVWDHLLQQVNMFTAYPDEYFDTNHYGPFFALVIAPFAMLPIWAGLILWNVGLAVLLYWANKEFSSLSQKPSILTFLIWFCANELYTALCMQQFNVAVVAIIMLAFVLVEKEKDEWATLLIVIGTLVKIYPIVALVFFLFSKHKVRFVLTGLGWLVVCFALPMLFSSPAYVCEEYKEWYLSLTSKNDTNLMALMQNISLIGMIRKIGFAVSGGQALWQTYSDLWVLIPACGLFAATLLRVRQWQYSAFRQTILASMLMMVCLFSSGTESSGYIIAMTGAAIWYIVSPWKRSKLDIGLMVFCFLLTSLSPTDIFPRVVRNTYIIPYALKALPVALIWFKLIYEQLTHNYEDSL